MSYAASKVKIHQEKNTSDFNKKKYELLKFFAGKRLTTTAKKEIVENEKRILEGRALNTVLVKLKHLAEESKGERKAQEPARVAAGSTLSFEQLKLYHQLGLEHLESELDFYNTTRNRRALNGQARDPRWGLVNAVLLAMDALHGGGLRGGVLPRAKRADLKQGHPTRYDGGAGTRANRDLWFLSVSSEKNRLAPERRIPLGPRISESLSKAMPLIDQLYQAQTWPDDDDEKDRRLFYSYARGAPKALSSEDLNKARNSFLNSSYLLDRAKETHEGFVRFATTSMNLRNSAISLLLYQWHTKKKNERETFTSFVETLAHLFGTSTDHVTRWYNQNRHLFVPRNAIADGLGAGVPDSDSDHESSLLASSSKSTPGSVLSSSPLQSDERSSSTSISDSDSGTRESDSGGLLSSSPPHRSPARDTHIERPFSRSPPRHRYVRPSKETSKRRRPSRRFPLLDPEPESESPPTRTHSQRRATTSPARAKRARRA